MEKTTLSRSEKLDRIFGTPVYAVLLAIFCNVLWGSAFPFIKLGYRLFSIDSGNTASIFCFAGVRFMLGSFLVLLGSVLLQNRVPRFPRGKVAAECCALGLWQTTLQYAFYYMAVALLTGAFGGILNSTQSFLGVIFAHFLYGKNDRMTPAKLLGCVLGFAGVLIGTLGNHGSGSSWGIFCMLLATVIFTLSGPWNKAVTKKADSFAVCFINLFVGGASPVCAGHCAGRTSGQCEPAGHPGAAVSGLHLRSRLCAVGPADEKQPCQPHCHLWLCEPCSQRAAECCAQRRAPVPLAVSGGAGVRVCGHLAGEQGTRPKGEGMTGPIFDTHAHYSARAFDADRFALLDSLPAKGVVGVCEQATHSGDAPRVLELAHRYPWVVAAIGIHPESLLPAADCGEDGPAPTVSVYGGDWAAEMRALAPCYEDPKVVAVGECGLDYHWPVPKDAQLALFEAEIRLALELDKPIIVHDRQAHADVYALLKKYRPKGIVHCYSGSADDAVWLAQQGLYIGFGGACTFQGAKRAAKAIAALPLEAIVLETDCPYMAPEPVRGTRCDSSLIRYVGEYIAQLKGISAEEVFRTTAENARRVYGL